jgi:tetratricopeptide (TPR) repeat protein
MSDLMSRETILTLLITVTFAGAANAQTPAPTPPTPPVSEPAIPPSASTPVTPLPPLDPTWIDIPTVPVSPRPVIAPMTPLPPRDFDFDLDGDFPIHVTVPMPKMDFNVDDFDFDFDFDTRADVATAMTVVSPRISAAVDRAMSVSIPRIATSISRNAITRTALAPAISTSLFDWQFSGIATTPRQSWASADPADSLYRIAREALNRGEYRRASQLFEQITGKYPNSVYAADSRYWKAFALYRIGSADDLREALKSLESGTGRYSSALQVDAPTLATRIRGALAARGDNRAATLIQREASQTGTTCDKEDIAVRIEALNSLGQMDPESVTPMLRRLLERRDECSAGLRRSALFLLVKRNDADAFNLLTTAAKSDPDPRIRADAIRWLARVPTDQAVAALTDIVNNGETPDLKMAAIEALGSSDNPRARTIVHSLITRTDLNERFRAFALQSIDAEHTEDGGAFLRSIYPQLDQPSLQLADIRAIARVGGPDNDQWLLGLVKSQNVSLDVRRVALGYAGRSTISIGDLVRMYDTMADRPLREQLISLYARRTEPEATDKLIDIAKNGTDPELRRLAISNLSRKNDPRTKKLLLEIIDR